MKWNVSPEIFSIGSFSLRWYGLLFAVGFLVGNKYTTYWFRKLGVEKTEEQINKLFTYIFLGTIIGARLAHCLFYDPEYYLSHIWEIPMVWKGGLASHGGYTGVIVAIYLFQKGCKELNFLEVCDLLSAPALFCAVCIRLGNLFNSEIIGKETDLPWGVIFTRVDPFPRHPTQVYEMLTYVFVTLSSGYLYKRFHKVWNPGKIFGYTLIVGMGARIFIEFTKVTQSQLVIGLPINMGQILSLIMCGVGFYFFFRNKKGTV